MSRLCVCREYEDMFTEGFKYVESLDTHDKKVRVDAIEEVKAEYKRMFNCGYTDCVTCDAYCNARKFMDRLEELKEK